MKKINGMIDHSNNGYFERSFRGYLVTRIPHNGYYTALLDNMGRTVMSDTIKGIKKLIRQDIEFGKAN